MITNSSFPSLDRRVPWGRNWFNSIYFFPKFQYLEAFRNWSMGLEAVASVFLSSQEIVDQNPFTKAGLRPLTKEVSEVVILICGHGARDQRCGVMGPLLGTEFFRLLFLRGVDTSGSAGKTFPSEYSDDGIVRARVAMVSHIGGHAFAGNVIIYIPPSFAVKGRRSALAGKGIWYGRVEPKHVEGIIEETIFKGRVIADLFRGGIEQGGNILRL
ncbi:MAG: hypothetical protein LQ347_006285 [Umbilicaria vellea]|nr:MAG: hypothetical protein LQ347_006285 [Umbilicaria vellea]